VTDAIDWFLGALRARREVVVAEVSEHFTPEFVEGFGADGIAGGMTSMAIGLQVVDPITTEDDGTVRVPLSATSGGFAPFRVRVGVDRDRLTFFDFGPMEIEGIAIDVFATSELATEDTAGVHRVFDAAYVDGDHSYLDAQLSTLASIAVARGEEGIVGFALSDARVVDLPRLPQQVVRTAGLACVLSAHKRKGISARLESMAMAAGDVPAAVHTLLAGRFAHPAGTNHLRRRVDLVPRLSGRPSGWQREVAIGIAGMWGVTSFDADTFVGRGPGRPVGRNVIDVDDAVAEAEADLFSAVDRGRGDTLLGLWWTTPPLGWTG
jgi:hypothetical protein